MAMDDNIAAAKAGYAAFAKGDWSAPASADTFR